MKKYFVDSIKHGALGHKLEKVLKGSDADLFVDLAAHTDELKAQFKNVCAPIHVSIDKKLEEVCAITKLSKREFITMAIDSALKEAQELIDEVNFDDDGERLHIRLADVVEKDGEQVAVLEIYQGDHEFTLDSSNFEGDLKSLKPGDDLEFYGKKYRKVVSNIHHLGAA